MTNHLRHAYVPDGSTAAATTDPEIYITVQHKEPGQPIKRVMRQFDFRMFMQARDADGILKGEINDMIKEISA